MIQLLKSVPELSNFASPGLNAIKGHRQYIALSAFRPDCSADLDAGFRATFPQSNRWDSFFLAINKSARIAVFFEVHNCTTKEVSCVLAKYSWLKEILISKLNFIYRNSSLPKFFWVAVRGNKSTHHSRQYRQISKSPIRILKIIKDNDLA